jgi:hypothetical protein
MGSTKRSIQRLGEEGSWSGIDPAAELPGRVCMVGRLHVTSQMQGQQMHRCVGKPQWRWG